MKPLKIILCVSVFVFGCDTSHPATEQTNVILSALQYRDFETVASHHLDTTTGGPYCAKRFSRVLDRVKTAKTEVLCSQTEQLPDAQLEHLDDAARLLHQMALYVCTDPEPTCEGYGRRTLIASLTSSPDFEGVSKASIEQVVGDSETAVVYVDISQGSTTHHRTLKFERSGQSWLLQEGLFR